MSYPFGQKPPQWSIDSGVVAYNASRLGLPMPVGLWAMWEKGGGLVRDLSGQNNDFSVISASWVPNGLNFDGANDYLEKTNIDTTSWLDFSVSGWFSPTITFVSGEASNDDIFSIHKNTSNYVVLQLWESSGVFRIYKKIAGILTQISSTNASWTGGQWYHFVYTQSSISGMKLYIDGVLQADTSLSTASLSAIGAVNWARISSEYYSGTTYFHFKGKIDNVSIFNRALNKTQVQTLYTNPYGLIVDPYQIELLAYVAAGGEEHVKNLSDTINLSDAHIFLSGLNRSDLMSLSDSQIKNIGRPTTDTISISDGIAKNIGWSESDSITISDEIVKTPGLPKADTITLSDNASMVASFLRSLNDTINLSDDMVKSYRTTKADIVTMLDSVAKLFGLSINDVTSLSEIIVKQIDTPKADSITLSDDITKNFGVTKSDTITLSDNLVSIIITLILNLNDTINLSDDIVKNVGIARADTINISDNFSKVIAYLRSFADTITLSDLGLREVGLNKTDTVTLSDSATKEPRLSKADTIALSENIAKELGLNKTDTITLSDFFSSDAGGALLFIIEQLGLSPISGIF